MGKTKRMIYIWEENVDFYDSLENKSDFINRQMLEFQNKRPIKQEYDEEQPIDTSLSLQEQIDERRKRDLEKLRISREEK